MDVFLRMDFVGERARFISIAPARSLAKKGQQSNKNNSVTEPQLGKVISPLQIECFSD